MFVEGLTNESIGTSTLVSGCVALLVVWTTGLLGGTLGYLKRVLQRQSRSWELRDTSLAILSSDKSTSTTPNQKHTDSIASRRWKEVLAWAVFHPDELLWVDKRKQTALHHACLFRAPADVIAMLLHQAPELAGIANMDDEIPLHWAVRLSTPNEVIQCLLSAYPASACSVRDKDGNTALSLVWDRHEEDLVRLWWDVGRKGIITHAGWKGILYFLQCFSDAVAMATDGEARCDIMEHNANNFFPLHAAALCQCCPSSMFPLFLQVYKQHVMVQDSRGRTPLAVACLDPVSNRSLGALTKVHLLITENTEAACMPDHSGRMPVFTALESGLRWEEGVDRLLAVFPHSLQLLDPVTRLPPFLLAATAPKGHEDERATSIQRHDVEAKALSTIFMVLRTDPAHLTFLL